MDNQRNMTGKRPGASESVAAAKKAKGASAMAGRVPATAKPKSKKKVSGAAVFSIFLIILLIAGAGAVYFNVGGIKQIVIDFLQAGEVAEEDGGMTADELAALQADIEQQQQDLEDQKAKLKEKQQTLDNTEEELNTREDELAEREATVAEQMQAMQTQADEAAQAEQAQSDLQTAAKMFEDMDADTAAKMIAGLDLEYMADLFLNMSSDSASAILSEMNSKTATKVLAEMVKQNEAEEEGGV